MAIAFLYIVQKYFILKEHDIELPLKRYLTFNEKTKSSLYFFLLPTTHLNLDFTLLSKANPILLISFLLISTLGISHGAFDGKIIWESGSKKNAFILYLIYISISLLGLMLCNLPLSGLKGLLDF